MRRLLATATILLIFICCRDVASATDAVSGMPLTTARANHALVADPSLSDPAWTAGLLKPGEFWNVTKRRPADLHTDVYLLFDDRALYVAFRAHQDGVPIVASQRTNGVGFGLDDFVGVAIDTSGAGNQVYFFETTPLGTRYQQSSDNVRYAPRWESASRIDGSSWTAVLVIPLDAMRMPAGKAQRWRLNFVRAVAARGEHYTWAYNGLMSDGVVGQSWPAVADARFWPVVALQGAGGPAGDRPRAHAELYALSSAGSDHDRFQESDGTFRPRPARPVGVDFTIPITATINAVGTLDPDFSNVETDQQTIVPQEFPRQLQEFRPFFAQGARFLNVDDASYSSPTSPNLATFYSPRIGPFDRGAKIEGTSGLNSLGILSFRGFDQVSGNTFDDLVYAFKHALADRTFEYWFDGVSAHHSIAGSDDTADFGARVRDLKTGFESGAGDTTEIGSSVPLTRLAHNSNAYVAFFKPNWGTALGYNDMSPNFNPIDGLTFNSDIRGMQGYVGASGATSTVKNYSVAFNWDRWMDRSGAIHEADTLATLSATFNNGISINNLGPSVGVLRSYDAPADVAHCQGPIVATVSFTGFPCYLNGRDARFDFFQTGFGYRDGTPRPTDVSAAFGPFGADYTQIYSLTTSRPLGRYSVGLEYDGTYEHPLLGGPLQSQWLRRLSLGASLGLESNVSLSLRSINGLGGFAPATGTDVAAGYHRRFSTGDELFVDFGTPAAFSTLHRFTIKYVIHAGGQ